MNVYAITDTYEALIAALRDRRMALGLSQTDVDLLAGVPSGYTSKAEMSLTNPTAKNARALGRETLPKMLNAVGLHLGVFSKAGYRPEKIKKLGHASAETGEKAVVLQRLPTNKILAERGRLGGKRRREVTSPEARRDAAKIAAAARWAAPVVQPAACAAVPSSSVTGKRAAARQRRENVLKRQPSASYSPNR